MQTSYSLDMGNGLAGLKYDIGNASTLSYTADAEINFGSAVVAGSDENHVKLPAASSDKFLGIALRTQAMIPNADGSSSYKAKDAVSVLSQGRVYVKVEEAVAAGDSVFVRYASGVGGSVPGLFRNDADTSTAFELTRARFIAGADAGGLAVIEINLP